MSETQQNKIEQSEAYRALAKRDGDGLSIYEERVAELTQNNTLPEDVLPKTLDGLLKKEQREAKLDSRSNDETEQRVLDRITALSKTLIPENAYLVALDARKYFEGTLRQINEAKTDEEREAITQNVNLMRWAYSVRLSPERLERAINADTHVLQEMWGKGIPASLTGEDPKNLPQLTDEQKRAMKDKTDYSNSPDFDVAPPPERPKVNEPDKEFSLKTGDLVAGGAGLIGAGLLALSTDAFYRPPAGKSALEVQDPQKAAEDKRFLRKAGLVFMTGAAVALAATYTVTGRNAVKWVQAIFRNPPPGFFGRG